MTHALGDPGAAREHARSQSGATVDTMPILPPSGAEGWPEGAAEGALWAETIAGGGYTALAIKRGALIELVDLDGDGAPHVVLYNALQTWERINVADTVKVQWQAYPRAGTALLSDQGRVLATIVDDTSGGHDTFTGTSTLARNTDRYGAGASHSATPAGREMLILAAAKFGLEPRDVATGITLFRESRVDDDGRFGDPTSAPAGARVRMRAEMPLILLLANVPHPLDPRPDYVVTPVRLRVWEEPSGRGAAGSDASALEPEVQRAMLNTNTYLRLRGGDL